MAMTKRRAMSGLRAVERLGIDDRLGDALERTPAHRAEEAASRSRMTGGTGLIDKEQQRVAVAIDPKLDQPLRLAGRFTLAPELAARPREIGDAAGGQRFLHRLAAHPGDHQHLTAVVLLRHSSDETVA